MANEFKLSYTAADINTRLGKIDSLAKKTELPTKTSDLTNDSNFVTENYVQDYAQPKGNYALKEDIPESPVKSVNGQTGAVTVSAVPSCTTSNNGQFLRVVNGVATWSTVPNAEEATF